MVVICSDEICNKDSFTPEELKEIHRLLYLDPDVLEKNGWSMDYTIYGMDTGCELESISD